MRNGFKYVEQRLREWADWNKKGNGFGLGFPSKTPEQTLRESGGVWIKVIGRKPFISHPPAEEIEQYLGELAQVKRFLALIVRTDCGFVGTSDGRRYLAMGHRANQIIGSMKPKGLKLYRALYTPQAEQLYERAVVACDETALRHVAYRYRHTRYGPKALAMLGAISFDRGRFAQAGRYWRQTLAARPAKMSEALLLAKIVVASHLAGEARQADEATALLKKRFPQAKGALAGREELLLAFSIRVRKMPVAKNALRDPRTDWPGLGGFADGLARMSDCDVVLTPGCTSVMYPGFLELIRREKLSMS